MPDVSTASADAAQNAILVAGTTYYLGLNTADPGATGANEGTDGRQAVTFAASSGGSQPSNDAQTWSSAAGGHTYTYFSIWTAATGGTFIRGGALNQSITPAAGGSISFASGAIVFTVG
jgi:hypothetical protein